MSGDVLTVGDRLAALQAIQKYARHMFLDDDASREWCELYALRAWMLHGELPPEDGDS